MPYTILIFAYRLPHLSPAAFKDYYETSHIPLLRSIAGPLFPNSHTRNYISRSEHPQGDVNNSTYPAAVLIGTQQDFEYDAIAELTFDNETAFQAFFGRISEPLAAKRIADDEDQFLDRAKLKAVLLEETTVTKKAVKRDEGHGDY